MKQKSINIKCDAQDGFLSNESFVTINTGFDYIETLCSKDLILNNEINLRIDSETEESLFVIIPGDIIVGNRILKLNKSLINNLKNKELIRSKLKLLF